MAAPRPTSAMPRLQTSGESKEKEVNVQVLVRCRPQSSDEKAARSPTVVKCNDSTREVSVTQSIASKNIDRTYTFDKVFGTASKQQDIFEEAVYPIVEEVLEGFNCTIFAYGQTGTGKTHTMTGDISGNCRHNLPEEAGVIPRAVAQIFQTLESQEAEYNVKCTFLELYNEEITDLLAPQKDMAALQGEKPLALMDDGKGGVLVRGLEEEIVKDAPEIFHLLERGSAKRHTAATLLNKQSSRSHSVFTITIHIKESTPEGEEMIKCGKLNLVDLAGSENISRSGAKDSRAREAGEINKSLLTLGRVITALVDRLGHVPYRDSKLTRLLRDSLGGHTKTCIIATVAPTVNCLEETLSTLDYAHRAKNIRNKPQVNQKLTKTALIKDMATEIERLKLDLLATREKNGIYLSAARYDAECEERKQLSAQVASMEAEIEQKESEMEEVRTMFVGQKRELQSLKIEHKGTLSELKETTENLEETTANLEEAREKIEEREHLIGVHEQAEDALVSRALAVAEELKTTAGDVMGLFDKVGRKNDLEAANQKVVNELQAEASAKLAAMQAAVDGCVAEQREGFASVRSQLDAFVTRKESEAAALTASLGALHAAAARATEAAAAAAEAQGAAASGVLGGMAAKQRDFTAEAQGAADESAKALESAFDSLSVTLRAQRDELVAFVGAQKTAAEAALSRARDMTAGAQATLDAMTAEVGAAGQRAAGQHRDNEAMLDKLEKEYAEVAAKEQEALMGEIGTLLAEFVTKKRALVTATVGGLKGSLGQGQAALEGTMETLASAAGSARSALGEQLAVVEGAKAEEDARLDARKESSSEALGAAAEQVAATKAAAAAHHVEAGERLMGVSQSMAEAADAGCADISAAVSGTREAMAKEAEVAGEQHGQTASALAAAHEGDVAACSALTQAAAAAEGRMSAFAASQAGGLGALSSHVSVVLSEEYSSYEATGASPRKRTIPVPRHAAIETLRPPASEVVYSEYRAAKAAAAAAAAGEEEAMGDADEEAAGEAPEEEDPVMYDDMTPAPTPVRAAPARVGPEELAEEAEEEEADEEEHAEVAAAPEPEAAEEQAEEEDIEVPAEPEEVEAEAEEESSSLPASPVSSIPKTASGELRSPLGAVDANAAGEVAKFESKIPPPATRRSTRRSTSTRG